MAISANDKIVRGADLATVGAQVKAKLAEKQDTLVSGTDIKTLNGESLLGSGNLVIADGEDGKSAYELWLDAGNVGTIEDYLASLKGNTGVSADYPITIYNGLDSTATDAALAAVQGKLLDENVTQLGQVLKERIGKDFFTLLETVDLSQFSPQVCSLGATVWYRNGVNGPQRHIAIPVSPGDELELAANTYNGVVDTAASAWYVFVTSSYNPPYSNNNAIPKTGTSARIALSVGSSIELTAQDNAAYLILTTVDGNGGTVGWSLKKRVEGEIPSVSERMDAADEQINSAITRINKIDETLVDEPVVQNRPSNCGGYIDQVRSSRPFMTSTTYYGGLILLDTSMAFKISVTKNPNGTCRLAFLKNGTLTNGATPSFCAGTTLIEQSGSDPVEYDVPDDCNYLYVYIYSSGTDVFPNIKYYSYKIDNLGEQLSSLDSVVNGEMETFTKELAFFALGIANNNRIYTFSEDVLREGDRIAASLANYSTFQLNITIMTTNIWGRGTEIWSSGWGTSDVSHVVTSGQAGNYVRVSVRRPNNESLSDDINQVRELLSLSTTREVTKKVGGLVKYVGEPIDTEEDAVDISGLTVQNCSLGATQWFMNGDAGRHMALPVAPGEKYRVAKSGGDSGTGYYGILTSSYNPPVANNSNIPYAPGCTRIGLTTNESDIVTIPESGAYLILCTVNGAGEAASWSVAKKTKRVVSTIFEEIEALKNMQSSVGKIKVVSWNVGHFCLGTNYDTNITHEQYAEMRAKWAAKINEFGADIFGTCEYNVNFVNAEGAEDAITAEDAIFSLFPFNAIGTKYQYNLNALFSNYRINSVRQVLLSGSSSRYYIVADISLGRKSVKFVETHLAIDSEGTRPTQIAQLVSAFTDESYVVIMGDFNCSDISEYQPFIDAGFNLANGGYLGTLLTWSAETPVSPTDNIICKGFTISKIETFGDAALTDHCAIMAELTLIP